MRKKNENRRKNTISLFCPWYILRDLFFFILFFFGLQWHSIHAHEHTPNRKYNNISNKTHAADQQIKWRQWAPIIWRQLVENLFEYSLCIYLDHIHTYLQIIRYYLRFKWSTIVCCFSSYFCIRIRSQGVLNTNRRGAESYCLYENETLRNGKRRKQERKWEKTTSNIECKKSIAIRRIFFSNNHQTPPFPPPHIGWCAEYGKIPLGDF